MPRIHVALGVAPEHADRYDDAVEQAIREASSSKCVRAIGSCGLAAPVTDAQASAFERQIALANELGLALVVEARGACRQALEMLESAGAVPDRVLLRVQDATAEEVAQWGRWGSYLSFDGRVADDPVPSCQMIESLPADRVVVESGAPDYELMELAGYPARTDQVVFIADAISSIVSPAQLAENVKRLFEP